MTEPAEALAKVLAALEKLEIPYFVGGSIASSVHGAVRATKGVDVIADIRAEQAGDFAAELGSGFYADPDMIRDAIRSGRAFNLIHYASTYKVDIFPAGPDPYVKEQLARRVFVRSDLFGGGKLEFPAASAEDSILSKLVWYRRGGGVSEQQWKDVLGVIRVQGGRLDESYLRKWADRLAVSDLLERALAEGGFSPSAGRPRC
jgi:hypothetical protein